MDRNKKRIVVVNPYAKKNRKRPLSAASKSEAASASARKFPTSIQSGNNHDVSETVSVSVSVSIAEPIRANDTTSSNHNRNNQVSARASALIMSASDKAGMEGIDRAKIDAIILRESGNSLYMQQQKRRDEKVNERVRQLQQRLRNASPSEYAVTEDLDEQLASYQRHQATRATCVVVDMDMFYMACELLSRPDLNHKPACVGRGMILTSNYVARRYGVRSAMPGFIGDKLVEELSGGRERLIHVRSNFDLYKEKSRIVTDVTREYDPFRMRSYSLDEVYLDIGPYLALFLRHGNYTHEDIRDKLRSEAAAVENETKSKTEDEDEDEHGSSRAMEYLESLSPLVCSRAVDSVVARLRRHVQEATGGLTCSAGVARTHSIAKIASDKNKPNGQLVVDPSATLDFVRELSVRKIPGIGRVTEKLLQSVCRIHTGAELYQKRGLVRFLFQPATANFLLRASVGCNGGGGGGGDGSSGAENEEPSSSSEHQKGISRERSFRPESDWAKLIIRLEDIARMVATDMTRKSILGHTITVKVKLETFDVLSRSQSQKRGVYVQDPEELATIASGLFASIRAAHLQKEDGKTNGKTRFSVRLLGIRCSNLIEESSFRARAQGGTIDRFLALSSSSPFSNADDNDNDNEIARGGTMDSDSDTDSESTTSATVGGKENNKTQLAAPDCAAIVDQHDGIYFSTPGRNDRSQEEPRALDCSNRAMSYASNEKKTPGGISIPVTQRRTTTEPASTTVTPTTVKPGHHDGGASPTDDVRDGTETRDKERAVVQVCCPLCSRPFPARDNDRLNAHIDTCLNGVYGASTVRRIVREDESRLQRLQSTNTGTGTRTRTRTAGSHRKRQRLTDFWN
mmetsp:Transcript_7307/g.21185  ORF Transcript_7307/g.21185 Transcript_7307/m.21185 type:complete len:857 (-) Transcript_7307:609-3179(-)